MEELAAQFSPPSQAFVDARVDTLGPWVIGSSLDCIMLGIVLLQAVHFYRYSFADRKYHTHLVGLVTMLSILKTMQSIGIIWVQNVVEYANPDVARLLPSTAWWQVSAPLITGITGCIVQCFFCLRFLKLSKRWWLALPICVPIFLGLIGVCLSTLYIIRANTSLKVRWLLIHLVSVSIADILITTGTVFVLRQQENRHNNSHSSNLIKGLTRMVFEAAVPPALLATLDLILTQTLKRRLLWHLLANYTLQKLYVISLLFTLNSIIEYRRRKRRSYSVMDVMGGVQSSRLVRADMDMQGNELDDIHSQVQIQVTRSVVSKTDQSSLSGVPAKTHTRWEKLAV